MATKKAPVKKAAATAKLKPAAFSASARKPAKKAK
jgi:hypothetical protein